MVGVDFLFLAVHAVMMDLGFRIKVGNKSLNSVKSWIVMSLVKFRN